MIDQELLSYLETFISPERKERFLDVLEKRTQYITVALEDVFQMHNTSAVIRSCDIFGIQQVHVVENKFGKRLDKNIAMGAEQWVDLHSYRNCGDCIEKLKGQGYKIVATTPHKGSYSLQEYAIDGKLALFFGTEKEGLSEEVLTKADELLTIPMVGFTESLNISVSAAIVLYGLTTTLRESDLSWRLTEEEKLEKRMDWTQKSIKSIDEILKRYHNSN